MLTAGLVLLGVAGYAAYHHLTGVGGGPRHPVCTVTAQGGSLTLEPQQAANASTIAAVAASRGLPERAVTIALATSMQESALRNLDHGDRDSVGLFQQRPSQGWGTAAQIMDPVYASTEFFEDLEKIRGYARLPLTVAAQKVQKSGFPQAYAKHEADAALLAGALTGRNPGALSCVTPVAAGARAGGNPAAVRARLIREFGSGVKPRITTTAAGPDGGAAREAGKGVREAGKGGGGREGCAGSGGGPAHRVRAVGPGRRHGRRWRSPAGLGPGPVGGDARARAAGGEGVLRGPRVVREGLRPGLDSGPFRCRARDRGRRQDHRRAIVRVFTPRRAIDTPKPSDANPLVRGTERASDQGL